MVGGRQELPCLSRKLLSPLNTPPPICRACSRTPAPPVPTAPLALSRPADTPGERPREMRGQVGGSCGSEAPTGQGVSRVTGCLGHGARTGMAKTGCFMGLLNPVGTHAGKPPRWVLCLTLRLSPMGNMLFWHLQEPSFPRTATCELAQSCVSPCHTNNQQWKHRIKLLPF